MGKQTLAPWLLVLCLALLPGANAPAQPAADQPSAHAPAAAELARYHAELQAFRAEFGGETFDLPDVHFFLFGMGARTKLIYKAGALTDAATGRTLRRWQVKSEAIVPPAYRVDMTTEAGAPVRIAEDETAVWIEENGKREELPGTRHPLRLPAFAGCRYPQILRVLHQELLINVIGGKPVPNFFIYHTPWYRDGAMMAMCFRETGNLGEIKDWVLGLREPYDRNNCGETEADNLGQALFLISLVAGRTHPLVERILKELPKFEVSAAGGKYLKGRSDFAFHPVYQTRWAKFGLAALGLPDPYTVPRQPDSYAALFWWADHESYVKSGDAGSRLYPYLNWAAAHFHHARRLPVGNRDYPLTWEQNASQADYSAMKAVDGEYARQRLGAPHTWHAAEVFLYLREEKSR